MTDAINNAMQASSTQIVQVMAVIVGVAVLLLLYAFVIVEKAREKAHQQDYELLKLEVSNNAKAMIELQKQTHTLNDVEFHLSSMREDTSENLRINRERAQVHDENKANIERIVSQQSLNQAELLTKLAELLVNVNKELERDPYLSKDDFKRWERKLDLVLERLVIPKEEP